MSVTLFDRLIYGTIRIIVGAFLLFWLAVWEGWTTFGAANALIIVFMLAALVIEGVVRIGWWSIRGR